MEASLEFVSSMLKNSLTWAEGGHIPAYLPITRTEKYKKLSPQSNYVDVADNVVLDPKAWFSGSGSTMEQRASATFQSAMAGAIGARAAYKELRAMLQEFVDTPRPI